MLETPAGMLSTRSGITPEGTLFRVFNSGLNDLDLHPSSWGIWLDEHDIDQVQQAFKPKPFSIMYAALAVLYKDFPRAPLYIVAHLWGFDVGLTTRIVEVFRDCELLALDRLEALDDCPAEDSRNFDVVLHALQYLHADLLCSNLSRGRASHDWPDGRISLPKFHRRLLTNFCKAEFGVEALTAKLDWASLILVETRAEDLHWYMVSPRGGFQYNLERHMVEAVEGGELEEEFLVELRKSIAKMIMSSLVSSLEEILAAKDREEAELFAELSEFQIGFATFQALRV